MQTAKIVQAVVLLCIVALAASCAATQQYTSKLFPNGQQSGDDTTAVALRFLDLDSINPGEENLVSTDIIMGRDTLSKTLALDNFSKEYPATALKPDSTIKVKDTISIAKSNGPVPQEPIAKSAGPNGVRVKKTREEQ